MNMRTENHAVAEASPARHAEKTQMRLKEISDHLREDIDKIDEPQAKALFETSAEVLDGLIRAFQHYEQKSEKAWL
jgi:hypothetical protein